jgi:hypothetical protein
MIIKNLTTIEKCASKLLQTCTVKSVPKIAMNKGLSTDVVQISKNLKNISFNEFSNILKRNSIAEFGTEDYLNFLRFNRNNANLQELVNNPNALKNFISKSRKMVQIAESCDKEIYTALKTGLCKYNGTSFNATVNPNILGDMESLIHTGRYFPKYGKEISTNQIMRETKVGDVFSINGKMFMNNGETVEQLAFNESNYTQMFPAIGRFNIHQGKIGNCYFVSQLEALMNSGKGRCHIYRMFSTDKAGNLYVQTSNNKIPILIDKINPNVPHIQGCGNGLTTIELAYGVGLHSTPVKKLSEITPNLTMSEGGWPCGGKVGLESLVNKAKVKLYSIDCKEIRDNLTNYLSKYAGKDEYLIQAQFGRANPNYNILYSHGYTIKSFSNADNTIVLTNPHRAGLDITVPISELGPFNRFSVTSI